MIRGLLKYLDLFAGNNLKSNFELTVFLTNVCNLSCEHCFYNSKINNGQDALTAASFKELASKLPPGSKKIILTGGEPFMRKDILDIIRVFINRGIKDFIINTNGTLSESISKFVDSICALNGVKIFIAVSLDGPEGLNDKIRHQQGAFNKTIETLRMLREKNALFGVQAVVSESNYLQLKEFDKYIYDNFKTRVHYQFVRSSRISGLPGCLRVDFGPSEEALLPSPEEAGKFLKILREIFGSRVETFNDLCVNAFNFTVLECKYLIQNKRKKLFPCLAGKTRGVIYPSGEVAICEYAVPVKTNLEQVNYDFCELWRSPEIAAQRKAVRNCFCTHGCFVNIAGTLRFLVYFMKNLLFFVLVPSGIQEKTVLKSYDRKDLQEI